MQSSEIKASFLNLLDLPLVTGRVPVGIAEFVACEECWGERLEASAVWGAARGHRCIEVQPSGSGRTVGSWGSGRRSMLPEAVLAGEALES